MTEDELRAIEARTGAACDMVAALCRPKNMPGAREWVMSIPARRSHDPDLIINAALVDIPRLAAALREAWERAEVAEFGERTERALNKERAAGWSEAAADYERRVAAAEADCKRLQDEVAALDAARREAEADLAGERGEYQRHSQGHMDRALAAEAAAAAMREALAGLLKHYMRIADSGDCGFWNPEEEPVVQAARAALKETSNG